jgi:hypothetical protein
MRKLGGLSAKSNKVSFDMAHLITFVTGRFDPAKETPNDINPIAGEALLLWLGERLQALGYNTTLPRTEDWGWYVYSDSGKSSYLVGASGDPEQGPDIHWFTQIHKQRSLRDRLFGRNKLGPNDALSEAVERLVRGEKDFRDVSVEKER